MKHAMQSEWQNWLEKDPNELTRNESTALIARRDMSESEQRCSKRPEIGPVGLRGIIGAASAHETAHQDELKALLRG